MYISKGHYKCLEALLKAGAQVSISNKRRKRVSDITTGDCQRVLDEFNASSISPNQTIPSVYYFFSECFLIFTFY